MSQRKQLSGLVTMSKYHDITSNQVMTGTFSSFQMHHSLIKSSWAISCVSWLIAREYFVKFSCRESFRSYNITHWYPGIRCYIDWPIDSFNVLVKTREETKLSIAGITFKALKTVSIIIVVSILKKKYQNQTHAEVF